MKIKESANTKKRLELLEDDMRGKAGIFTQIGKLAEWISYLAKTVEYLRRDFEQYKKRSKALK